MRSRGLFSLATGLVVATSGCGTEPGGPPPELTDLPRALTVNEQHIAAAANQFTFSLFQRLSAQQPDSNIFVSPLSVTMALGMTMNGAAGTTFDQMRSTLGFGSTDLASINAAYKGLMGLEGGLDPSTTFTIANSIWYRQDLSVKGAFIDAVKQAFDADVKASPFDASTLKQVNDWVSAKTRGKIPSILNTISPDDRMFLINAIYFKGSWRAGFDAANTHDGPFKTIDGTNQTVKLMSRHDTPMRLGFKNGSSVGELAYGNSAFVMTILVPEDQATVNAVAASLDTAVWSGYVSTLRQRSGDVVLPRFKVEYERYLNDDLKALGMVLPFDPDRADFSNMSPAALFIEFVKHKTYVNVDEVGTEAAAVTVVAAGVTSAGPEGLIVQRPFIFVIRERFSGTILFIGKIVRIPS